MNRKTLIILLSVVAILFLGIASAVIVLYSGMEGEQKAPREKVERAPREKVLREKVEKPEKVRATREKAEKEVKIKAPKELKVKAPKVKVPKIKKSTGKIEEEFLMAVPTDAVLVFSFGDLEACQAVIGSEKAPLPLVANAKLKSFLNLLSGEDLKGVKDAQVVLSYHNVGVLEPLMVLDICSSERAMPASAHTIEQVAQQAGMLTKAVNCAAIAPSQTYLSKRQILLISTSDVLLSSSQRHIEKGISVYDKELFSEAVQSLKGAKDAVYLSHESIGKVMSELLLREFNSKADAVKRLSDWTAFAIEPTANGLRLNGFEVCGTSSSKFMNVFEHVGSANVTAPSMIPSYAVSVFALPMENAKAEIEAYEEFFHTKSGKTKYQNELNRLRQSANIGPVTWADSLNIKEVAVASFYAKGELESVLLLKIGSPSVLGKGRLFKGLQPKGESVSADYPFEGFVSALFGGLFALKNESKYTYINGWIVVGSSVGVSEYVSGRALETTLAEQISGAGLNPELKNQHFWAYFSLSENKRVIDKIFREKYSKNIKGAYDSVAFAPAIMAVNASKGVKSVAIQISKVQILRSKAPEIERDTIVVVPKGPWKVMNSGTGKMNTFYQQSNMFLCLSDENGKGLWGAPFKTPLCGRAGTIDYYANGKLQILFCSGSKLYLIDRTGRFVSPFPVDLGKEVLLGPDIYDFNGYNKYNVVVLHKDNTVEMYNLHGQKPEQWKGITHSETIKGLPELLKVDDRMYWAVRTSLQTLIYPFYGGDPLTSLKGSEKLRPDTKLTVQPSAIKAINYNGKEVTIKLK